MLFIFESNIIEALIVKIIKKYFISLKFNWIFSRNQKDIIQNAHEIAIISDIIVIIFLPFFFNIRIPGIRKTINDSKIKDTKVNIDIREILNLYFFKKKCTAYFANILLFL